MSTRSNVGILDNDTGKVEAIYVHYDGYPSGVGKVLLKHYDSGERVQDLIDLGNASYLEPEMSKPKGHSFNKPVKGYSVFYGRDRGEEGNESQKHKNLDAYLDYQDWTDYVYYYDFDKEKWYWQKSSGGLNKWKDLAKTDFDKYKEGGLLLHTIPTEKGRDILVKAGMFDEFMNAPTEVAQEMVLENANDIVKSGVYKKGGETDEDFPSDDEEKLASEHIKEAERGKAEITNMGWGSGPDFIESKTDKGILISYLEQDGNVSHEWEYEEEEYATGGEVSLYFQQGSSDKEYHIQIEEEGGGYVVNFQYGRIGKPLKSGTKTPNPVSLGEAQSIYHKLLHSKEVKGYVRDKVYEEGGEVQPKEGKWSSLWKKSKELGKKGYAKSQQLAKEANEERKKYNHEKRKGTASNVLKETSYILQKKAKAGDISKTEENSDQDELKKVANILKENYTYPEGPAAGKVVAEKSRYKVKRVKTRVNEPYFEKGGVFAEGRVILADGKGIGGNKNKTYQLIKFDYEDDGTNGFEVREMPTNLVMAQGNNFEDVSNTFNLFTGKTSYAKGGKTDPIKLIITPDEYEEKVLAVLDDYGVKYGYDPEREMDNRMAEGMSYVIYDMDEEDIDDIVDELNHRKEGSFVFYRGDDPGNGAIEMASGSFAKGGTTKGKMKLIEEEYAGSGQKAKYRGLYNYEGDKLRVDINVDTSYAKQSSSGVYIYNKKEKEWNFLASIPWENMKTTSEISPQGYSHKVRVVNTIPSKANGEYRKKLIQDAFNTDRDTLLKKAEMILSDKFAKGGSLGDRFKEDQEWISRDVGKRYMIYTEKEGEKPTMRWGMNNKIGLKGYVEYFSNKFPCENVFVVDNKEDRQIYNYAKGGKVDKKGNEMIMGGIAGILLGVFLNK